MFDKIKFTALILAIITNSSTIKRPLQKDSFCPFRRRPSAPLLKYVKYYAVLAVGSPSTGQK